MQGGGLEPCVAIGAMRGRSDGDWKASKHEQRLEIRRDGVTNALTNVRKDNLVIQEMKPTVIGGIGEKNFGKQWRQGNRIYDGNKIAVALVANSVGNAAGHTNLYAFGEQTITVRRLTPKECFRLQGWTDDYFEKAEFVNSNSQLYKQAGNGVTVSVIEAIARKMK